MSRICILYLGRSGGPTVDTLQMCKSMCRQNHLLIVLSEYIENLDKYIELQNQHPDNVELCVIPTYKNKIQFLLRSLNVFKFNKLAKKIMAFNPDFVYLPMITLWGALTSLRLSKEKIVSAIHDPESHAGEKNMIIDVIFEKCIKHSYKCVVFSQKFVDDVCKLYDLKKENIIVLKLGGYSYYNEFEKSCSDEKQEKPFNRIMFFGRISKYKGVIYLLKAFDSIKEKMPDLKLRIVGNGILTDEESTLIKKLGNKIELYNRWIKDEEVSGFFKDVDFVVLPYIEATQSGIVMLSYANKKAVLATNVGALDEQIIQNETGILVDKCNVKSLADGIVDLYKDNNFIKNGLKGYELAVEEWTWEKQSDILLKNV